MIYVFNAKEDEQKKTTKYKISRRERNNKKQYNQEPPKHLSYLPQYINTINVQEIFIIH